MKTLTIADVDYYNVCYNHSTNKLQIIKTGDNPFTCSYDDNPNDDDNLACVFVINPVLFGMLKTLSIPFYKAKKLIISAINRDLNSPHCSNGKDLFNKKSNLYNLLVNEFGLKNLQFS
jgi:hypothetical protein